MVQQRKFCLSLDTFVAFDLETAGLNPLEDRIIEIGAVRVEGGRVVDRFEHLVNPGCPIPLVITRLTGLSQADCADQPGIDEVFPCFLDFVSNHTLVAHNAPFDLECLREQLHLYLPSRTLNNPAWIH